MHYDPLPLPNWTARAKSAICHVTQSPRCHRARLEENTCAAQSFINSWGKLSTKLIIASHKKILAATWVAVDISQKKDENSAWAMEALGGLLCFETLKSNRNFGKDDLWGWWTCINHSNESLNLPGSLHPQPHLFRAFMVRLCLAQALNFH